MKAFFVHPAETSPPGGAGRHGKGFLGLMLLAKAIQCHIEIPVHNSDARGVPYPALPGFQFCGVHGVVLVELSP